jgi:hypothetical protein
VNERPRKNHWAIERIGRCPFDVGTPFRVEMSYAGRRRLDPTIRSWGRLRA